MKRRMIVANHRKERVETAKTFMSIIIQKLKDARYTDDYKGMTLYLDDGLTFKLEIMEDKKNAGEEIQAE